MLSLSDLQYPQKIYAMNQAQRDICAKCNQLEHRISWECESYLIISLIMANPLDNDHLLFTAPEDCPFILEHTLVRERSNATS